MNSNDENFNQAFNLTYNNYSHEDLIEFLKSGSVIERQYSALEIDKLKSKEDAIVLVSNLTGVDGKIREAVAIKLNEFSKIKEYHQFLTCKENFQKLTAAVIDIDSNVCRLVIDSISRMQENEEFSQFIVKTLSNYINEALIEISKFTFRDKKYKINKQIFKIYWCLEAFCYFYKHLELNQILIILQNCVKLPHYTVKEKCAKLITKLPQTEEVTFIKSELDKEENYYVKIALMEL